MVSSICAINRFNTQFGTTNDALDLEDQKGPHPSKNHNTVYVYMWLRLACLHLIRLLSSAHELLRKCAWNRVLIVRVAASIRQAFESMCYKDSNTG